VTKAEENTIRNIVARLRRPEIGSSGVGLSVADQERARLYLDTWIIGPLEMLLPGEARDPNLAERMSKN
jgi:hypothetical protein